MLAKNVKKNKTIIWRAVGIDPGMLGTDIQVGANVYKRWRVKRRLIFQFCPVSKFKIKAKAARYWWTG
jgi:hypothetical protein